MRRSRSSREPSSPAAEHASPARSMQERGRRSVGADGGCSGIEAGRRARRSLWPNAPPGLAGHSTWFGRPRSARRPPARGAVKTWREAPRRRPGDAGPATWRGQGAAASLPHVAQRRRRAADRTPAALPAPSRYASRSSFKRKTGTNAAPIPIETPSSGTKSPAGKATRITDDGRLRRPCRSGRVGCPIARFRVLPCKRCRGLLRGHLRAGCG